MYIVTDKSGTVLVSTLRKYWAVVEIKNLLAEGHDISQYRFWYGCKKRGLSYFIKEEDGR